MSSEKITFEDLGLAPGLLRALDDLGHRRPTPIQEQTIPLLLDGCDVLGAARAGTGKTGAYLLPTLQRLAFAGAARPRQARALILTPTRAFALQVLEAARSYAAHLELRSAVVHGGVKMPPQRRQLAAGVDLLVATPGRLRDLLGQNAVRFDHLEVFVLDEADRMLDMGFIHDIGRLTDQLPRNRQTLMFSATFSPDIRRVAERCLDEPRQVRMVTARGRRHRARGTSIDPAAPAAGGRPSRPARVFQSPASPPRQAAGAPRRSRAG